MIEIKYVEYNLLNSLYLNIGIDTKKINANC